LNRVPHCPELGRLTLERRRRWIRKAQMDAPATSQPDRTIPGRIITHGHHHVKYLARKFTDGLLSLL